MSRGTILAHKHTLCEAFTGFFRALATERFFEVRQWLHPELELLIRKQCDRVGEAAFLRNLRYGLGSATQRVRLGASQAEGARQIRTELLAPTGQQAGSVRFVLSPDGWRIYSLEVFKDSGSPQSPPPQRPIQVAQKPVPKEKRRASKLPRMSPKKWFSTIYASRD
jgi:hypothetical protein